MNVADFNVAHSKLDICINVQSIKDMTISTLGSQVSLSVDWEGVKAVQTILWKNNADKQIARKRRIFQLPDVQALELVAIFLPGLFHSERVPRLSHGI